MVARPVDGPVWGIYVATYDLFRTPTFDPDAPVARAIRENAGDDRSLVVWGWRPDLYVLSGLTQGVRYPDSTFQIEARVYRQFFRDLYIQDFQYSRPAVFVDAVGHSGDFHDYPQ